MAQLRPGQKILIIGASGSVGSFAVQLAHALGAQVTAVSSGANLHWVKALGADQVIDYTQTNLQTLPQHFDVVFDTVGKSSFVEARKLLKAGGLYLTTVLGLKILWQSLLSSRWGQQKARFVATGLRSPQQKQQDLDQILALWESGALQVVIDRIYPFEALQEAHAYVDRGHKKGNVVVAISAEAQQPQSLNKSAKVALN